METVGGNVDWPCPCEANKHARGNVFFCRLMCLRERDGRGRLKNGRRTMGNGRGENLNVFFCRLNVFVRSGVAISKIDQM
jgi:hypothetical protein